MTGPAQAGDKIRLIRPEFRLSNWVKRSRMGMTKLKGLQWTALALLALAALLALRVAFGLRSAHAPEVVASAGSLVTPESFRWPAMDGGLWKLFRSGAQVAPQAVAGALSARYRLAGVFLVLSDTGRSGAEPRCAILDDLQTQQQYLASEGESLDQVRVVRVENDRVVLSDGSHEETIYL